MVFAGVKTHAQWDSTQVMEEVVGNWEVQWEGTGDVEGLEDAEGAAEELLERIEDMRQGSKPNLNDLSYEVAVNRLHLTDYQYYQLQLYIEEYGQLYSLFELPAVNGFSDADMRYLSARAVVEPPPNERPTLKRLLKAGKNVFWIRYGQFVERQAGYDTARANHYAGSPAHVQFRYDYQIRQHFGFRIAGEKDAGEAFFRGAQRKGFDHYSGSVYLKNIRWVKCAVLGDYRLNYGQGVVLGSSMMSGKGAGVSAMRRFGDGIRPVATTNESSLFRGGALTVGDASWSGSAFAGRITECKNTALGGALSYRRARFSLGGQLICYGSFADSATWRQRCLSLFHSDRLNAGLSYQMIAGKALLFGEAAVNEKGRLALLQAATVPVSPVMKVSALLRYYATGYQSPMGSGFRASSGDCGEFGVYLAGHLVLSRNAETDIFFDYYRLQWLSYRTDAPVPGMDAGGALNLRLSRKSMLMIRYQWKTKPKNENEDPHLHRLTEQCRHRFRLQWTCSPLPFLDTKTECGMVLNKGSCEARWRKGVLMYQDLAFNFPKPKISLHLRVAYFDTDSYDERLYAYENDVYYAFTVGSYYYQGIRAYLMLRYKIQNFSIWLRVARTHYLNRETISSGLNEIDKPHKTEVKVQGMYRF